MAISSDNEFKLSLRITSDLYCFVVGNEIFNVLSISALLYPFTSEQLAKRLKVG
jgi:hypothetical protein